MTTAAVAPFGFEGGSNDTNHVSPLASRAVNPGAYPDAFSRMITHFSGAGGGPTLGPRSSCSSGTALTMRLVNQLESGTSSMVLMFCARVFDGARSAVTKRLKVRS